MTNWKWCLAGLMALSSPVLANDETVKQTFIPNGVTAP